LRRNHYKKRSACCIRTRRGAYLFASNRRKDKAISRIQAWRVLRAAVNAVGIMGKISLHSLRKSWDTTPGQAARCPPSSSRKSSTTAVMTRRYLGVAQDDLDKAYLRIALFG